MDFSLNATQTDLQTRARALADAKIGPRAAEIDRSEQYPWDNVEALKDAGFLGMTIPTEYGGAGLGCLETMIVVEEMARVCGISARIVVDTNMGGISAIMTYGSEEQKKLAAGLVLSGDKPAICITEPGAGSAASQMTTRADKKGDRYIINGKKHWITGAGITRLFLVFARVFDEAGEEQGIGGFIAIGNETKGLRVGKREPTMGLRGIPESELFFEDMEVPASMMLAPPRGLRKGFGDLMKAYNAQRVGAATVALGLAQGAYEHGLAYAKEREQFGRPIGEFQGVQWMLADMSIKITAARTLLQKAASNADKGFPDITEAAQAKIFTAEMAIEVTNQALQLFGAAGYSRNRPLERMARDARMFTIGGGTVQILRNVVAAGLLEQKLPQTRDGYLKLAAKDEGRAAAE